MNADDRAVWLAERRLGVGSSDAPAILGLSPWKTPIEVYLEKLGEAVEKPPTLPMLIGIELEEPVARLYSSLTGRDVSAPGTQIIRHPNHPWIFCSPDRFTRGPDGVWQVLEIKTSSTWEGWGATGSADIPPHYYAQVQHQLLACSHWADSPGFSAEAAIVAVLIAGTELRWYVIPREQDFIDHLFLRLANFWQNHVEVRVPPPVAECDEDGLKHLFAAYKGKNRAIPSVLALGPDYLADVDTYGAYGRSIRELEADRAEIRNRIAEAVLPTGHDEAMLPDGRRITIRSHEVKAYTVEAQTRVSFRIHAAKGEEVASATE